MSTPFYDLASLVVVPSGYKASKVYAQKPLTTDGQLTFSRASTATRVNSAGLIETVSSNVPRLDYQGSTCPKLLLEPQRTNDVTYSEQFTNAAWTGGGATGVADQAVSPDGYTNADLIYPTTSGNYVGKYQNVGAATTGVVSCYVKQAGKRFAQLGTDNNATYTCAFDLQLGTVVRTATNYTATITSVGNGWFRITAAYVSSAAAAYPFVGVSDNANGAVTVDGTNGLYVWGFQYERSASYATSYIPTTTAVTRLADACSKTGISSLIGQTEGVLFYDFVWNGATTSTADYPIVLSGSDFNNFIGLNSTFNSNQLLAYSGGSAVASISGADFVIGQRYKIALAYKANDFVYYVNGTLQGSDTSGAVPIGLANLQMVTPFGSKSTAQNANSILFFKTRLTNAQLAELTAL